MVVDRSAVPEVEPTALAEAPRSARRFINEMPTDLQHALDSFCTARRDGLASRNPWPVPRFQHATIAASTASSFALLLVLKDLELQRRKLHSSREGAQVNPAKASPI